MTKAPKPPKNLAAPSLNPNAEVVLAKRYLKKGEDGEPHETPGEMFWRVASIIAAEEEKYDKSTWKTGDLARAFYDLMTSYRFLPNSPTLMNAGNPLGQLAACFVLPVGDSMEEIFDSVKHAAIIHKSGGGTGFSFSRLRPKNSMVGSTGGVASGPVSFMKIFNTATEQVKQGGTRRGANMGILRVDHPDIREFITAKERETELNNFNISVALTEKFMKAVGKDEKYELKAPHTAKAIEKQNAKEIFELLAQKAWESGDPGIVFLDRINRDNPTPEQGEIESTNPCGEQPLLPYEACNLGSINLAKFYDPGANDGFDWDALKDTIHLCVRFLDNVIDASKYPLPEIEEKVRRNRKIGLGIMGWADLLFQLGIAYDSQAALDLGEKMMRFTRDQAWSASKTLAAERGAFPAYEQSVYAKRNLGPYRNATVTTIAPTGTLSIIAGCSSGIEPLFALSFSRHVMDGEKLVEVNSHFEQALRDSESWSKALMQDVAEKGTVRDMEHVPDEIRRVFVTAMDVKPIWHLKMQAAFQKHTDNAVSKTVNLPNEATVEDIREIYRSAYEYGCKGVTVYRSGCKSAQVLCTGESAKKEGKEVRNGSVVRSRPDVVYGFTRKMETGLGTLYLTVNEADGKPFEVFATIGKSGRSVTAKAEAIGRLVSLALRSNVPVSDIVEQLEGIGGEHPVFQRKGMVLSIPDAIAKVFSERYLGRDRMPNPGNHLSQPTCPDCGGELVFQEGCYMCGACGFTKCG